MIPQQQAIHVIKDTGYWWIPIIVALIVTIGGIIKVLLEKRKKKVRK